MHDPHDLPPLAADHVLALEPYRAGMSAEQLARERGIRDAVKLASNENPFGPSPRAIEAIRQAAAGAHRYPDAGSVRLTEALAAFHGVSPREITLGHGSNDLIGLLCRTFAGPSGHAVIGTPSFVAYPLSLQAAGVPFTRVPLTEGLYWDLAALRRAIGDATRLCFIDNPNNPTSTHVPRARLADFLTRVPPHVLVVVDEAYAALTEAPDYASALTLRGLHERLVVLRTFSKVHGLAALRLGYAIATPEISDILARTVTPFSASSVAQAAALAALADTEHVARYVAVNARERTRVTASLRARGLTVAPSQTNFLCVRFPAPAAQVYAQLLERGVITRPLPAPLDDALRISIGTPPENDRLLAALDMPEVSP